MKNNLFWRLCWIIAGGTVVLFWVVDILTNQAELQMSFIEERYQQQMVDYAAEAERIYLSGDNAALSAYLKDIQERENTWAAVVLSEVTPVADSYLSKEFIRGYALGRSVKWKIHLYFKENPIMEVPIVDERTHFLIQLPPRMRPGGMLPYTYHLLQIGLPFALLCGLALILYRHIMTPLKSLEKATRQFSQGKLDVRVRECLGNREDELTALAETFDQMAERTGSLIITQRQLLGDLSHELRTPLARMDMAVDGIEQGLPKQQALARLRQESVNMRELVEDALTLAWLNTETPTLNTDDFDLVELVQVICEDARFEYPNRCLVTELPIEAPIEKSSQRALGQALENVIRNGLKHTPDKADLKVSLVDSAEGYRLEIRDQGEGVPEAMLGNIFKPFFQLNESRTHQRSAADVAESDQETPLTKRGGFGLGLALAQRQVAAIGGKIRAENYCYCIQTNTYINQQKSTESAAIEEKHISGLRILIDLPRTTLAYS